MDLKRDVGNNLKAIRTKRGHSREALARLANVSAAAIVQIEMGNRWPRPENIVSLAEALNVSPWYFFHGENEETEEEAIIKKVASLLGVAITIVKNQKT